jgi:predicted nucleic acid-binding protein
VTTIVVDASVAAKLLFPEAHSDKAELLYRTALRLGDSLIGPPLLPIEITNVIRKRMRQTGLTAARANIALDDFLAQPIVIHDPPRLHHNALRLATAHGIGAHDAHYVALAEMFGCDFWVDDQRLLRAVQGRLPFVRWIGDYAATAP